MTVEFQSINTDSLAYDLNSMFWRMILMSIMYLISSLFADLGFACRILFICRS